MTGASLPASDVAISPAWWRAWRGCAIRSAVADSPIAAEVMLDTLANAAIPVQDERRRALLKDQAEKLAGQARLSLVGPDLDRFERHVSNFNKAFW